MSTDLPMADITAHPSWRDQLAPMLNSTGEGIYGVDLDGCGIFINRAGSAILGYCAERLLGCNMNEAMHLSRADGEITGAVVTFVDITVRAYCARIMEKIETHNDVETALYAVRHHLTSTAAM